ncbi:alcohol dehydrogenase catalytic domain-containing protein [Faecalimonas sp. LCP19S3_D12]
MINYTYQLVSPQVFSVKYHDIDMTSHVLIRPKYMAICHADQRYYLGKRDHKILKKKLPMALIHECCGEVVYDPTNTFAVGELVVPIPNDPIEKSDVIYENYLKGSKFKSSGYDGFMREYIDMPADRIVSVKLVPPKLAAITEFVSVAVHAVSRFQLVSHNIRKEIGIWGDGSLSYCVANVIKTMLPESRLTIIGRNPGKLAYFSFAERTFISDELPEDFQVDHGFECCGGEGSYYAFDDMIQYLNPQGTIVMMGVSENRIPINTRDVLEKGITMLGCSRSGRTDFELAAECMAQPEFQKRIESIIYEEEKVSSIADIHRVFRNDLDTMFKTVFEWEL